MVHSYYGSTQQSNGRAQGLARAGSSNQPRGLKASVVIGFADGSSSVYQLHGHWHLEPSNMEKAKDALQALLSG